MMSLLSLPLGGALTAAACSVSLFACLDADPVLFAWDLWWNRQRRLPKVPWNDHTSSDSDSDIVPSSADVERIWIIGASSGIGEELAYQLAAEDSLSHLHLILSSRSEAKLQLVAQTCRELSAAPHKNTTVTILPLDVCNDDALLQAVLEISKPSLAPLDTVVLNAGGGHLSPVMETSSETAQAVWRLNAHWPMVLVPLLLRHNLLFMEDNSNNNRHRHRRRLPHLVVTSSVAGVLPVPLSATYAAAKHALQGYFRSLAAELPHLCLHIMMPGPVATNFHRNHVGVHSTASAATKNKPDLPATHAHHSQETKAKHRPLQMPVQRCARLMRTAMRCFPEQSRESWIASQPVLTGLYLQKILPQAWMQRLVHGRIGPRRVALYQAGLDLYDPASWRTSRRALQEQQHVKDVAEKTK